MPLNGGNMKKGRVVRTLLFMWIGLVLLPGFISGSTYYVSPSGSDTYSGSFLSPWRTMDKANRSLQSGDTLFIRQGTYLEDINPTRSGMQGNPIVYINYPNETVELPYSGDCSNPDGWRWAELAGIPYEELENNPEYGPEDCYTIELCEGACDDLQSGAYESVSAGFGCGPGAV